MPTRYAADHSNAALAETLLRRDNGIPSVTLEQMESYALSWFRVQLELVFSDLADSTLFPEFQSLLREGREAYVVLRGLAATVHKYYPERHGLRWTGKQLGLPGFECYVFFGDRVEEADLEPLAQYPLTEGEGLYRLRAAATWLGGILPEQFTTAN